MRSDNGRNFEPELGLLDAPLSQPRILPRRRTPKRVCPFASQCRLDTLQQLCVSPNFQR